MSKTKLAIIVPVYNVEPYIEQCLTSLVNQTMQDIEIICVDDCGTDNSMKIVEKYAKTDKRIKIVHNEQNSGLSESRNNGVRATKAEYVMFCDSDDWFADDMCEKMYNAITAENADWAICGTQVIYEADHDKKDSDDVYFAVTHSGTHDKDMNIMRRYAVCAWNKIYKRDILVKNNVWFPRGLKYEDEFMFRAYMTQINKIAFVPEKLYKYRRRAGSIMNTTFKQKQKLNLDYLKIAFAYYEFLSEHNLPDVDTDAFWGYTFVNMMNASLNQNAPENWDKIYDIANDFIRQHYGSATVSFDIMCAMDNIIKRHPPKRKYLGGLVRVNTTPQKYEWRIIGIPVWKIKRIRAKTKYYLLGIRIAHKNIKPVFCKPNCLNEIHTDDTQLVRELTKLGKFSYIPNPGNAGDMLIAAATLGFFDKYKLPFQMYKKNGCLDAVVYGGGGIWTADYKRDWIKHLEILKKAKQIVILPSSFNNCPELIDALDERFVVFCREKRSFEYMVAANTGAKIILDHDMAFRMTTKQFKKTYKLSDKMIDTLNNIKWGEIPRTAMFMRADRESAGKYKTDLDVSELAVGYSLTMKPKWINFCAQLMLGVVNQADVVVTDRLHVAIASLLAGKTVYMLDNTYGKLSAVYNHSMTQLKNVHFCTEMPEL